VSAGRCLATSLPRFSPLRASPRFADERGNLIRYPTQRLCVGWESTTGCIAPKDRFIGVTPSGVEGPQAVPTPVILAQARIQFLTCRAGPSSDPPSCSRARPAPHTPAIFDLDLHANGSEDFGAHAPRHGWFHGPSDLSHLDPFAPGCSVPSSAAWRPSDGIATIIEYFQKT